MDSPQQARLSEGQERQSRRSLIGALCKAERQHSLYVAPRVKRVWAYQNGGRHADGTYVQAGALSEVNLM